MYPFGPDHGDTRAPTNDDGSTTSIQVSSLFPFFNHQHDSLIVNTNGVISFLGTMSTFTPSPFPLNTGRRLIAPYWCDIDTRNGGDIWYREVFNQTLLQLASDEVKAIFPEQFNFKASWMFIATWDEVAFYGTDSIGKTKRCTFQCVLITNGRHSFTVFLYDKIEWTTGTASGGSSSTGLGGTPAQVGFDAGDGINYFAIEASRTTEVINVTSMSNVGVPGKFVFRVDSSAIENGGCNVYGTLTITPSEASMFGGTRIIATGPCFNLTENVYLEIADTPTVGCQVYSEYSVSCIIPPIYKTGKELITLRILESDQTLNFTGSLRLVNHAYSKTRISRHPSIWSYGSIVNVSWLPGELGFHEDEILMLEFYVPHVINNHTIVLRLHSFLDFIIVSSNIQQLYSFSFNFTEVSGIMKLSSNNPQSPYYWSDMFTANVNITFNKQLCDEWVSNEETESPVLTDELTPCPCSLDLAFLDTTRFHIDPLCITSRYNNYSCYNQPDAKLCFRLNSPSISGHDHQCCYDDNDLLMNFNGFDGSGFYHRYHYESRTPFLSNFVYDIAPYQYCCVYPTSDFSSVDLHSFQSCSQFYLLRPPNSCLNYVPPRAARVSGDPHFVTFDGLLYTFNPVGEFHGIKKENFTLQLRMEQFESSRGSSVTSFVAKSGRFGDIIEVKTSSIRGIDVLLNGKLIYFDSVISKLLSFDGGTVEKPFGSNSEVTINFPLEQISINTFTAVNILNLLILVPTDAIKGHFLGLFGDGDGNSSNDLASSDGNIVADIATTGEIYYRFGLSWRISANESLFTYPNGRYHESYQDPLFTPLMEIPNDISVDVLDTCGSNIECQYDYYVTGNKEFGTMTRNVSNDFIVISEMTEPVATCGFPYKISHASWKADGYTAGSHATLVCDDAHYPINATTVCTEEGIWQPLNISCVPYENTEAESMTTTQQTNRFVSTTSTVSSSKTNQEMPEYTSHDISTLYTTNKYHSALTTDISSHITLLQRSTTDILSRVTPTDIKITETTNEEETEQTSVATIQGTARISHSSKMTLPTTSESLTGLPTQERQSSGESMTLRVTKEETILQNSTEASTKQAENDRTSTTVTKTGLYESAMYTSTMSLTELKETTWHPSTTTLTHKTVVPHATTFQIETSSNVKTDRIESPTQITTIKTETAKGETTIQTYKPEKNPASTDATTIPKLATVLTETHTSPSFQKENSSEVASVIIETASTEQTKTTFEATTLERESTSTVPTEATHTVQTDTIQTETTIQTGTIPDLNTVNHEFTPGKQEGNTDEVTTLRGTNIPTRQTKTSTDVTTVQPAITPTKQNGTTVEVTTLQPVKTENTLEVTTVQEVITSTVQTETTPDVTTVHQLTPTKQEGDTTEVTALTTDTTPTVQTETTPDIRTVQEETTSTVQTETIPEVKILHPEITLTIQKETTSKVTTLRKDTTPIVQTGKAIDVTSAHKVTTFTMHTETTPDVIIVQEELTPTKKKGTITEVTTLQTDNSPTVKTENTLEVITGQEKTTSTVQTETTPDVTSGQPEHTPTKQEGTKAEVTTLQTDNTRTVQTDTTLDVTTVQKELTPTKQEGTTTEVTTLQTDNTRTVQTETSPEQTITTPTVRKDSSAAEVTTLQTETTQNVTLVQTEILPDVTTEKSQTSPDFTSVQTISTPEDTTAKIEKTAKGITEETKVDMTTEVPTVKIETTLQSATASTERTRRYTSFPFTTKTSDNKMETTSIDVIHSSTKDKGHTEDNEVTSSVYPGEKVRFTIDDNSNIALQTSLGIVGFILFFLLLIIAIAYCIRKRNRAHSRMTETRTNREWDNISENSNRTSIHPNYLHRESMPKFQLDWSVNRSSLVSGFDYSYVNRRFETDEKINQFNI